MQIGRKYPHFIQILILKNSAQKKLGFRNIFLRGQPKKKVKNRQFSHNSLNLDRMWSKLPAFDSKLNFEYIPPHEVKIPQLFGRFQTEKKAQKL